LAQKGTKGEKGSGKGKGKGKGEGKGKGGKGKGKGKGGKGEMTPAPDPVPTMAPMPDDGRTFEQFDTNGDGFISEAEILGAVDPSNRVQTLYKACYKTLDADGDGMVSMAEIEAFDESPGFNSDAFQGIFTDLTSFASSLDVDGDLAFDIGELEVYVASTAFMFPGYEDFARNLFTELNTNGDEYLRID